MIQYHDHDFQPGNEPQYLDKQENVFDCLKAQEMIKSTETLSGMGSVMSKGEASLWDQTPVGVLYTMICHNPESFQLNDILEVRMVAVLSSLWGMVPMCSTPDFYDATFWSYGDHKDPEERERKQKIYNCNISFQK